MFSSVKKQQGRTTAVLQSNEIKYFDYFNELFTIKNKNTEDHTDKVKEISCRWANFTIG